MPIKNKKAEAASKVWERRKTKATQPNRPKKLREWNNESMLRIGSSAQTNIAENGCTKSV